MKYLVIAERDVDDETMFAKGPQVAWYGNATEAGNQAAAWARCTGLAHKVFRLTEIGYYTKFTPQK